MRKVILVTGAAGFIGSNLVDRLLANGHSVIGVDNFNDYYDPDIKEKNIKSALFFKTFKLHRMDILDRDQLRSIFRTERPERVIHLAARTGVRPSIEDPHLYASTNCLGTVNLLGVSVDFKVDQFIFGSSSSVYGNSTKIPFKEDDRCENIISPYGASKRSAEFFVEVFAKSSKMNSIILRFFTVYGPRGRPDMAPALFTSAITNDRLINQFGDGSSRRDYTFIDDIVDGIIKSLDCELKFAIINLGNNHPIALSDFIKLLEKLTGKKARIRKSPKMTGDAEQTWSDVTIAGKLLGWSPRTSIEKGLASYIKWQRAEN